MALVAIIVSLVLALPIIAIVVHLLDGSLSVWNHLVDTVLWDYLLNSLGLLLGVGFGVLFIGVPTAWLTSCCEFPGRKFFTWALLLPLAIPAYIIAYTYTGLLDFTGPIQTLLRSWLGNQIGVLFDIRSLSGAIVMLALVLYPYVYLLGRTAFLEPSASVIDAGRLLGYSYPKTVFKLLLPMARPAIVAGLTLALMETLADFGTVQYFGVSTFTTGIFRAFYGFGDTAAAAQLASILLSFVVLLIFLERYSRRQIRYHGVKGKPAKRRQLSGARAWVAVTICTLPFLLGFLIPVVQLAYWTLVKSELDSDFLSLAWHVSRS